MKTRQVRRNRTQWTEIIERQSQSGQTIRTFCKENDISLASFGKWKKKLQRDQPGVGNPVAKSMFHPVSLSGPEKTNPLSANATTVTLSLSANFTLTIQTNALKP